MKLYNYISALLIAGVASFSSCSQEDDLNEVKGVNSSNGFQITVSDGGFLDTTPGTRAVENGYTTEFADGDAIGVFAVDANKKIVSDISNRKFTMKNGTWTLEGKIIEYKGAEFETMNFYAYYPYNENVVFEPSKEDPFETYVNDWTVEKNQSGEEYTKYDLMTSSSAAVVDNRFKGEIKFTMQHRMALVVLKMPKLVYDFANADVTLDDYELPITNGTFKLNNEELTPYQESTDTYRFLVKPGTEFTVEGTYTGVKEMTYKATETLNKGTAKEYTITDTNKKEYTLSIGDYYCADGSIVSKDTQTVPDNVIGIVCYVGNPQPSVMASEKYTETNDALRRDYPNCTHGVVLAKTYPSVGGAKTSPFSSERAGDLFFGNWYLTDESWADKFVSSEILDTNVPKAFLGYNNTVLMTMSPKTLSCDKAVSYLEAYREEVLVPNTASNWYIPSLNELDELAKVLSAVQTSIEKANGDELLTGSRHWSNNERIKNGEVVYQHTLEGEGTYIFNKRRNEGGSAGYYPMMLAF